MSIANKRTELNVFDRGEINKNVQSICLHKEQQEQ